LIQIDSDAAFVAFASFVTRRQFHRAGIRRKLGAPRRGIAARIFCLPCAGDHADDDH
jgi:hypothetical protein